MLEEYKVKEVSIVKTMSKSFLDYAMSVIVSRAIPDVRDGLKPVHRRILYAMHDLGIYHNRPHKKSARIVGDVIGKYHPHGDSSVYDAMVRLAQTWKVRVPLVSGAGNFGSVDGDAPAAMRYTEARLKKTAHELLKDLKDENGKLTGVVDFKPNFDGEEKEPVVLPGRLPNLLINGTEGIAVGMATSMAPHNPTEVIKAIIAQMDNKEIEIEELMTHITGPDFPTGGIIMGDEGFKKSYLTGNGSVVVRGVVNREEIRGREALVITEIPFQVNKEKLFNSIAEIQKEYDRTQREILKDSKKKTVKKIVQRGMNFIAPNGLRDESTNDIRVVIELKDGVNPERVLNYLYKNTQLQTSFGIINLALVPKYYGDNQVKMEPKVLNLKELISEYIKHQQEVQIRKLQYDLKKKEKEMRLLEAVIKAINKMDETVQLIKKSKTREEAIEGLIQFLEIEQDQASHILNLRLQTLANYEQEEKKMQHEKLGNEIKDIQLTINDEVKLNGLIKEDMNRLIEEYGEGRRTSISHAVGDINEEDLIPVEDVVITMTRNGFIKRMPESKYRTQRRNGIGVNGMNTYEGDFVRHLQIANTHDTLMCISNLGAAYKVKAYQIPVTSAESKGVSIKSIFELEEGEYIQEMLSIREFSEEQYLTFGTKQGIVKRTKLSEYARSSRNGIRAVTLNEGDEVVNVALTNGEKLITLFTKNGVSITFSEEDVKVVSRSGKGVKGITLAEDDYVVSVSIHTGLSQLFIATNLGFGKRTKLSEFRIQNRGGKGVRAISTNAKNGYVIGTAVVEEDGQVILLTINGTIIKMNAKEVTQFSRAAQGSKIITLRENDELIALDRNSEQQEEVEED